MRGIGRRNAGVRRRSHRRVDDIRGLIVVDRLRGLHRVWDRPGRNLRQVFVHEQVGVLNDGRLKLRARDDDAHAKLGEDP